MELVQGIFEDVLRHFVYQDKPYKPNGPELFCLLAARIPVLEKMEGHGRSVFDVDEVSQLLTVPVRCGGRGVDKTGVGCQCGQG